MDRAKVLNLLTLALEPCQHSAVFSGGMRAAFRSQMCQSVCSYIVPPLEATAMPSRPRCCGLNEQLQLLTALRRQCCIVYSCCCFAHLTGTWWHE